MNVRDPSSVITLPIIEDDDSPVGTCATASKNVGDRLLNAITGAEVRERSDILLPDWNGDRVLNVGRETRERSA